jgi:hypothetical protein
MKRAMLCVAASGLLYCLGAQTVTFNQPSQWMSCRSAQIEVKALLDTAKAGDKPVTFTLYRVTNGKKASLGSQIIKSREYSQEFTLASVAGPMIGGQEYLQIEWTVKGKSDKGVLEPFGVAVIDEAAVATVAEAKKVKGDLDVASAKAALGTTGYASVGEVKVGIVWTDKAIGVVCPKGGDVPEVTVCFDGKNGKNAFLSYPDRFVSYFAATDSVHARNYARSLTDAKIVYKEREWVNEITKSSDETSTLIVVPWHDTGMIPFEGRMIGCALFTGAPASVPEKADREIPGTWGNLVLK